MGVHSSIALWENSRRGPEAGGGADRGLKWDCFPSLGPRVLFFFLPTVASTRVSLDIGSSPQKEKGTGDAQPRGSKGEER